MPRFASAALTFHRNPMIQGMDAATALRIQAGITKATVCEGTIQQRIADSPNPPTAFENIHYYITRSLKAVIVTHIEPDPSLTSDQLIDLAFRVKSERSTASAIEFTFGERPNGRVPNGVEFAAALTARKFTREEVDAIMIVPTATWTPPRTAPAMTFKIVETPEELREKIMKVEAPSFECSEDDMESLYQGMLQDGFVGGKWVHVIASEEGEETKVVAAVLFVDEETQVATLFGLATVHEARKKGLALGMLKWLMEESCRRGCDTLALAAHSDVEGFYSRIGFEVFDRISEWSYRD
ncbi:hypothetical protein HKX48_006414 [Thoreauomyces humboldtii]|nr:hypothetical protein HKX48_006414 [Thoreauomyces humboldtii]